ncbi:MAG TPA: hypothetical protein VEK55_06655, partial [Xanthobacteraceae bacterium]|nr:hypothetical protein [Xanthobacteraceae bacterium]
MAARIGASVLVDLRAIPAQITQGGREPARFVRAEAFASHAPCACRSDGPRPCRRLDRRRRAVHLKSESEPIFNVPPVVTIILLALV